MKLMKNWRLLKKNIVGAENVAKNSLIQKIKVKMRTPDQREKNKVYSMRKLTEYIVERSVPKVEYPEMLVLQDVPTDASEEIR